MIQSLSEVRERGEGGETDTERERERERGRERQREREKRERELWLSGFLVHSLFPDIKGHDGNIGKHFVVIEQSFPDSEQFLDYSRILCSDMNGWVAMPDFTHERSVSPLAQCPETKCTTSVFHPNFISLKVWFQYE